MINNCMSYALRLENDDKLTPIDTYFFSGNKERNFAELSKKFHIKFRQLNDPGEPLLENEWLIAFIGFFPTHWDYEGIADNYDCHFILKTGGFWMHRPGAGKEIVEAKKEDFLSGGPKYPPQYFAVKRVEE